MRSLSNQFFQVEATSGNNTWLAYRNSTGKLAIAKLNRQGDTLGSYFIDYQGIYAAVGMEVLPDDGLVICAKNAQKDFLIKTDSQLTVQWAYSLDDLPTADVDARGLSVSTSPNLRIGVWGRFEYNSSIVYNSFYTIFDINGTALTSSVISLGSSFNITINSVSFGSSISPIVSGSSTAGPFIDRHVYNGMSGASTILDTETLPSGRVIGIGRIGTSGSEMPVLIEYDNVSGYPMHNYSASLPGTIYFRKLDYLGNGKLVVAGERYDGPLYHPCVFVFDTLGDFLWGKDFEPIYNQLINDVLLSQAGDLLVTMTGTFSSYLIQTDSILNLGSDCLESTITLSDSISIVGHNGSLMPIQTTFPLIVPESLTIDPIQEPQDSMLCFSLSCNVSASFTSSATMVCTGESVGFQNNSLGAVAYHWLNNGQLVDSSIHYSKVFATSGMNTISLIAIQSNGCRDTASFQITVSPLPMVNILGLDSSYTDCDPDDTLVGVPQGGNFRQPVQQDGTFSPSSYGVGTAPISYSYTDSLGCAAEANYAIDVFACVGIPPLLDNCSIMVTNNRLSVKVPYSEHNSIRIWSIDGVLLLGKEFRNEKMEFHFQQSLPPLIVYELKTDQGINFGKLLSTWTR